MSEAVGLVTDAILSSDSLFGREIKMETRSTRNYPWHDDTCLVEKQERCHASILSEIQRHLNTKPCTTEFVMNIDLFVEKKSELHQQRTREELIE